MILFLLTWQPSRYTRDDEHIVGIYGSFENAIDAVKFEKIPRDYYLIEEFELNTTIHNDKAWSRRYE